MNAGPFDIAVVGNGVIGLSIALAVAEEQPTAHIGVIGPADRRYGATPASGAMLGCFGEVTASSLATSHGRDKLALAREARRLWPDWLALLEAGSDQIVTARDTVVLLNTVGAADLDSANFAAVRQALREAGEPDAEVDVADVGWLDPDPNARPLRALPLFGEGAVDSGALLSALTTALDKRGVTIVEQPVVGLQVRAGRAVGLALADETIAAGAVVVAAGAESGPLLQAVPELAHRVPMVVSGCGVSALADTVDGTGPAEVLRTPNRAFACGLHVLPRHAGTVYLGATNEMTFAPRREAMIAEVTFLANCAVRQIHRGLDGAHLRRIQVGNRPMSIDGWPLLGPTSVAGLWVATGTYRDGLHLSPLLARDLARRVTGQDGLVDLEAFRPEREPVSPLDRAGLLDEVVRHTLATGFEVPWQVDVEWPATIAALARAAFAQLLDELGDGYLPPPEVLSVLLKSTGDGAVARLRTYYQAVHAAWH